MGDSYYSLTDSTSSSDGNIYFTYYPMVRDTETEFEKLLRHFDRVRRFPYLFRLAMAIWFVRIFVFPPYLPNKPLPGAHQGRPHHHLLIF